MKHTDKLTFLFCIIIFLLISILTIELFNDQMPDRFYCGIIDPPIDQTISEEINFVPLHETGAQLFRENCKSCHKVHEESVGPALSGVSERRPRKWIYGFVKNSSVLIDKGDTMAVNLYNKYNKADMTSFPSFTEAEIDSILVYIEYTSKPMPIYAPPVALP